MSDYTYDKTVDGTLLKIQISADEAIEKEMASIVTQGGMTSVTISFDEELTESEESALDALVAAHDASDGGFYEANHVVCESIPGKLTSEKWYQDIDGNNVVSHLAKEVIHEWSGSKETRRTTKIYFKGGVVAEEHVLDLLYDSSAKKSLEKKVS